MSDKDKKKLVNKDIEMKRVLKTGWITVDLCKNTTTKPKFCEVWEYNG
jgi:hypothetical protein